MVTLKTHPKIIISGNFTFVSLNQQRKREQRCCLRRRRSPATAAASRRSRNSYIHPRCDVTLTQYGVKSNTETCNWSLRFVEVEGTSSSKLNLMNWQVSKSEVPGVCVVAKWKCGVRKKICSKYENIRRLSRVSRKCSWEFSFFWDMTLRLVATCFY